MDATTTNEPQPLDDPDTPRPVVLGIGQSAVAVLAERFSPWPEASAVSTAPAPDQVLTATRRALAGDDLVPGAGIEPARPRRAGGV